MVAYSTDGHRLKKLRSSTNPISLRYAHGIDTAADLRHLTSFYTTYIIRFLSTFNNRQIYDLYLAK